MSIVVINIDEQGGNHGENLVATSVMVGRICPHGGDGVKVLKI
jgi:hypothetical protein